MDNATAVSATNVSGGSLQSTVKDLPIAKVWAFAVGQFGWALLSGIISNWLVYFYQPDQETVSQGQTVFVPWWEASPHSPGSLMLSWTRPWPPCPTAAIPKPAAACPS